MLLICLLVIALPLKAVAAVTMVGCGPVHHAAGKSVKVQAAAVAHDHGSHASGSEHHGSSGDHAAESGGKPDGAADSGKHHGAKMANAKCSSCAPCCAAAAPAPELHRFAGIEPAADELPFAATSYRGVIDDVPHKPPRPFLA